MNLMIDTLGYAEALEQSGFTSEQAKGAAKALNNTVGEELATKADLAQLGTELRSEMAETRTELSAELHTEINKVRTEIAETRTQLSAELQTEINKVRTEIAETRAELSAELHTEINKVYTEINKVRTEIAETRAELRTDIAGLRAETKGDIKLVHWTLGVVVVAVVIPLVRDFLL